MLFINNGGHNPMEDINQQYLLLMFASFMIVYPILLLPCSLRVFGFH